MQHPNGASATSPRAALTPLSTRDLPTFSLAAVQESPDSSASSPVSAVLSPTQSDRASDMPVSEKAENLIRRAISCSSLSGGGEVKQRRKRSRVTPEQLVKLEDYFVQDNSPTSSRRKDIAHQLGMDERQTQIWFQNRRAKAKLQLKLKARAVEKFEPPPESPPELASGFDVDLHGLIHEDEEVTVFPCTELAIGTWRRMASQQHDLIVYICEAKRCVTWFVRSGGRSFKMEIPYESILESRFSNVSPGVGSVTFLLERPPTFYMESLVDVKLGEDSARFWQVCGDWTEAQQGTAHLQHCLVGPAYQLSSLVNTITPTGLSSEISLYTPTPPVSDAGSSPEVYARSLHSPVDTMHTSNLVLRRPSSLSSLRMLHHPSLERLRSRHASTPLFHSPLSSTSTPNSPYALSDGSISMSPTSLYLDSSDQPQYARLNAIGTPDQLTSLPLTMPNLPRYNHELPSTSRSASPYEFASEPPVSALSTPGGEYQYLDVSPPSQPPNYAPWGGAVAPTPGVRAYLPPTSPVEERPHEPYYPYPNGLPGPANAFSYESSGAVGVNNFSR